MEVVMIAMIQSLVLVMAAAVDGLTAPVTTGKRRRG
jgi:hypothetical protein